MTDYFHTELNSEQLHNISALGLAHIGDVVYELLVRTWLCATGKCTARVLHHETVRYVNAPAQAKAIISVMDELTDKELAVYKRGRNAKVNSVPKNANIGEYHSATGLEALFGFLYLNGEIDRINELFGKIMED